MSLDKELQRITNKKLLSSAGKDEILRPLFKEAIGEFQFFLCIL